MFHSSWYIKRRYCCKGVCLLVANPGADVPYHSRLPLEQGHSQLESY